MTAIPSTVEGEGGVLAALLTHNNYYDGVASKLRAEHFAEPIFGRIYEEIGNLLEGGDQANAITVARRLSAEPAFRELGGARYLLEISNSLYAAAGLGSVDHIIDMARRRKIRDGMADVLRSVCDQSIDVDQTVQQAEDLLASNLATDILTRTYTMGTAFQSAVDEVERLSKGALRAGVSLYGFQDWDDLTGGMMPGQYILLGGRPSMGKTALSLAVARRAAQAGHGVLYISREMDISQLMPRMVADILFEAGGESTFEDIQRGHVSEAEMRMLRRIQRDVDKWPLIIVDPDKFGAGQIGPLIRRYKRTFERRGTPLGLVIIDYLGLIDPPAGKPNREQEVSAISQAIKGAARSNQVATLVLTQLSRAVERREDKRPQLDDLRDSGTLEQDADVVIFVYRDQYYLQASEPDESDFAAHETWSMKFEAARDRVDIYAAKNRQGEKKRRKAYFFGARQAIRNSDYREVWA